MKEPATERPSVGTIFLLGLLPGWFYVSWYLTDFSPMWPPSAPEGTEDAGVFTPGH